MKAKPLFVTILGLVSVLSFLSVALSSFGVLDINYIFVGAIFIAVGSGLVIEGSPRAIIKYLKNGLTRDEVTHILAILFGLFGIIAGVLTILNIGAPLFEVIKGYLSIFMIILIVIETWVVK